MSDKPRKERRKLFPTNRREIGPPVKVGFDGKVIPSHARAPVKYWKVNVGASLTGKRKERHFFPTEREANEWRRIMQVVSPWPHNASRHSFGSYYLGLTRNEQITASEMGNSPAMVFKHYREIVHPEDVERYWKIMPPGGAANVVPGTNATRCAPADMWPTLIHKRLTIFIPVMPACSRRLARNGAGRPRVAPSSTLCLVPLGR